MANSVLVARESTHGTLGTTFKSIPCAFSARTKQKNAVVNETRNSVSKAFKGLKGRAYEEFDIKDSYIYHDTFGMWLASALGPATKVVAPSETTVWDHTFKVSADPATLSVKHDQPRRSTNPQQFLQGAVDKLTISFAADGDLKYSCSGVGLPHTTIAAPTYAFSDEMPFESWTGDVTLDGVATYAKLISGSITISRNRKPWFAIKNTVAPQNISVGEVEVSFDLLVDFASTTELQAFLDAKETAGLTIKWQDADKTLGTASKPELTLKIGRGFYEDADVDTDADLPTVKIKGTALYNSTDASELVAIIRSTYDYTTA